MSDSQSDRAIKASANDNSEPFKRKPTFYVDPSTELAFRIENAIVTRFDVNPRYIKVDMIQYDNGDRDDVLVNYWYDGEDGATITSYRYYRSTGEAERT